MNYHDDCLAVRPIVCAPCDLSRDLCDLGEEGEGARTIKPGFKPSVEEVNNHNLTHIPFRSWCPFCVAGKAKDNPHFRVDQEDIDMNVIDMDYMFLSGKEPSVEVGIDQVSEDEDEEEDEDLVECDGCGEKDIDPSDLDDSEKNLAEIGGGYAHEGCMSDEQTKEYEAALCGDENEETDEELEDINKEDNVNQDKESEEEESIKRGWFNWTKGEQHRKTV